MVNSLRKNPPLLYINKRKAKFNGQFELRINQINNTEIKNTNKMGGVTEQMLQYGRSSCYFDQLVLMLHECIFRLRAIDLFIQLIFAISTI